MKVTYAHLCDYASISREGKLSAMGIFDNISAITVPTVQMVMHLAFEIELSASELRRPFQVMIKIVDEDGNDLVEITAEGLVDVPVRPGGAPIRIPQTVALGGTPLPKFGSYSLDIFLNGDMKRQTPFSVIQFAAPAGTQPPAGGLPQ